MKIYISDDIYEYLAIGKRDIHSGVDDDLVVKSLEQHDKELLREFADKILEIWYDEKVTQIDGDLYKFTERAELIAREYNGCREQVEHKINELLKERCVK